MPARWGLQQKMLKNSQNELDLLSPLDTGLPREWHDQVIHNWVQWQPESANGSMMLVLRPPGGGLNANFHISCWQPLVALIFLLNRHIVLLLKYQQVPKQLRITTTTSGLCDLHPLPGTLNKSKAECINYYRVSFAMSQYLKENLKQ